MTLAAVKGIAAVSATEDGTGQPLDSDLTAIAALSTTAFGRSVLTTANAAAGATLFGVGTGDTPSFAGLALSGNMSFPGVAQTRTFLNSDVADSSRVFVGGGSALSTGNGGYLGACGVNHATQPGWAFVVAGGPLSTAKVYISGDITAQNALCLEGFTKTAPSAGFTITLPDNQTDYIIDPAGTLATGTFTMPAAPKNGQVVKVMSSQIVTALTVSANAGQSIKNAPTTIAAGGSFSYIYVAANTTWYRRS